MSRLKTARVASIIAVALFLAGTAAAADNTYLAVRGGLFLPNGKGGGDPQGFKNFDTGYGVDVAAGYRPEPYVALEIGTGFYSASGKVSTGVYTADRTATGVPVTLSAKGILEFEKLMLSGGAGIGYYFAFIDNNITFTNATPPVSESNHGAALGYQVLFDADFKVSPSWTVGANFKWFTARPEIELYNPDNNIGPVGPLKTKWEIGGMNFNLGAKYFF